MNALLLMLILADGAALPGMWKGRISDLKCGAIVETACNRRCIEEGQQAVLVEDETGEIRPINNTDFVKKYAGAYVEVNLKGRPDQRPRCEATGQVTRPRSSPRLEYRGCDRKAGVPRDGEVC
jgi:hypothetical protein